MLEMGRWPNPDAVSIHRRAVGILFSQADASRRINNICNGASWPSAARAPALSGPRWDRHDSQQRFAEIEI
jgi:hypothetical protein